MKHHEADISVSIHEKEKVVNRRIVKKKKKRKEKRKKERKKERENCC